MPKVSGLTLKQRKWLEIYLETGNASKAARRVYRCTEASARVIGHQNLTKLNISELFEVQGMTLMQLLNGIAEGMKATKLIKANLIVQKDNKHDITNKQLVEAAKELNGVYMEVPDFEARHKYLITALRLSGTCPRTIVKAKEAEEPAKIRWIMPPASLPQNASL